jgi:hypothetical protein
MPYTRAQRGELIRGKTIVSDQLNELILRNVMVGGAISDQGTREYLQRGVGRRLNVIFSEFVLNLGILGGHELPRSALIRPH